MDEAVFKSLIKTLGGAVKDRRQKHSLTQEEVAFGAGVSVRHYQQLESGQGNPTFLTLYRIATLLELKTSELIKKCEEKI